MRVHHRKAWVFLLLFLIISQLGLSVHAASHTDSDHSICQICHAYNHSAHALTQAEFAFHPSEGVTLYLEPVEVVFTSSHYQPYQQRAPPVFD